MRTPSMCRSAVMSAIRPTACRAASTVTTNSIGITACIPTPSGSGHEAAPLKAIVAAVSSHAVWRSRGKGIRSHVSSKSSASSTQMPASMPIGNTSEKLPNPFCRARERTAEYEPANPIPAMTTAPATTTPMSIRCVRVSCIAATRDPLPLSSTYRAQSAGAECWALTAPLPSCGRHSVRVTRCQRPRRPRPALTAAGPHAHPYWGCGDCGCSAGALLAASTEVTASLAAVIASWSSFAWSGAPAPSYAAPL